MCVLVICCVVVVIRIIIVSYLCNLTVIGGGGRLKTIRVPLPSSGTVHIQYTILSKLKKCDGKSRMIAPTPFYTYYTILFNDHDVNDVDF